MFEAICQGVIVFASVWGMNGREVVVPDGGTVIIGARVFRTESSLPPLLLRVPYVNRLFRTVGYASERLPDGLFERIGIDFEANGWTAAGPGNSRTPILPPIKAGECPMCDEPPDQPEILRALPKFDRGVPGIFETFRDDIEFTVEKLVDRVDPPRFFPLIGPAQLHHCHWKCTVHFAETTETSFPWPCRVARKRVEVVYIDKDHLHLASQWDIAHSFDGSETSEPPMACPGGHAGPKVVVKSSPNAPTAQQVEIQLMMAQINRTAMPAATWTWLETQLGLPDTKTPLGAFGVLKDQGAVMSLLQSLRSDGFVKILAEPRVTTLSGRPATIISGGEAPSVEGDEPAVTYKHFGTKTVVVPTVDANGKLYLDVRAEIRQPAGSTRRANVGIDIVPGRTLMVRGLVETQPARVLRVPILADMPVIGDMFEFDLQPATTRETVILVTPRILDPKMPPIVQAGHAEPAPFPAFPAAAKVERSPAMTIGDVVRMSKKGIASKIILRQMELMNPVFNLTVDDIIELHDQGVSEEIIHEMQDRRDSGMKPISLLSHWQSHVRYVDDTVNKGKKIAGLAGRLYLFAGGSETDANGTVVVTLHRRTTLSGGIEPASKWTFDAETLKKLKRKDFIGDGYTLFLPLPDVIVRYEKVEVIVTYQPNNGSAPSSSRTTLDLRYESSAMLPHFPQYYPANAGIGPGSSSFND